MESRESNVMKSEDEINKIVTAHGGKQLQFSQFPTWVDKAKTEGFELRAGVLRSFWIREDMRVYNEPPSGSWEKVIAEIKTESGKQNQEQVNSGTVAVRDDLPAVIPDTFTLSLMEKWEKMTAVERMFLFQSTPADMIASRQGPGGSVLKYVRGNKMIQELNIAFLFNWSSLIEEVRETETGYWVRGSITVVADGIYITRSAIGTADKHKGVNNEDVAKAAAMDMIKKAASSLGFNGDVYRGEV